MSFRPPGNTHITDGHISVRLSPERDADPGPIINIRNAHNAPLVDAGLTLSPQPPSRLTDIVSFLLFPPPVPHFLHSGHLTKVNPPPPPAPTPHRSTLSEWPHQQPTACQLWHSAKPSLQERYS